MTSIPLTPRQLYATWESQQRAFIEFRNERTETMIRLLKQQAAELGRPLLVLDIGSGPGSLTNAVLTALPDATVISLDRDPVLLRLATETCVAPSRAQFHDVDLRDPNWTKTLLGYQADAAISATALHWLEPNELTQLYRSLSSVLKPGGIMMNADHLLFNEHSTPWLAEKAEIIREQFREAQVNDGILTWDSWWETMLAQPGWEKEATEHRERWADKHNNTIKVSTEFHLEALQSAGFSEVAQVWQFLDDRIVFGRKPTP